MSYAPDESTSRDQAAQHEFARGVQTRSDAGLHLPSRRQVMLAGLGAASALLLAGCSAPADAVRGSATPSTTPVAVKPAVAAVSPAQASVIGQHVTITGTGLKDVKQVTFGTTKVPVTSASATKVVVAAPAAANYQPGTVDVALLDGTGATLASKPQALTYVVTAGVGAQMQYALAHWTNYNTAEYGDLNPVGGDCANFVSQTLIARGWTMTDQWYNHNAAADWGSPWGYVPSMDTYFADNAESLGLEKLTFSQEDRAKVGLGDVGIFFWGDDTEPDHTEVVDKIEKVDGQYKISLASHNNDVAFRDLDTTITTEHPGSTGHFWHLTR
ncbi:amidase domain-containing protein [Humibacter sp. RRB41]|uniref:amidase domain-containing protein n=1 Tax=Humibacter sp. RRB41 TaxID=2919946 RepID=UPI001FAAE91B|nr:amidase domain-containing protein [Humibacter sp. RRB41]